MYRRGSFSSQNTARIRKISDEIELSRVGHGALSIGTDLKEARAGMGEIRSANRPQAGGGARLGRTLLSSKR